MKKIIAIICCLAMILSVSVVSFATEPESDEFKIIIDLTDYSGGVTGAYSYYYVNENGSGNIEKNVEIKAGQVNEIILTQTDTVKPKVSIKLDDFSPENYKDWTVSGLSEEYYLDDPVSSKYIVRYTPTKDNPFVTLSGNEIIFFELRTGTWGVNKFVKEGSLPGGSTLTIKPGSTEPVSPTVNASVVASPENAGTVTSVNRGGSNCTLIAIPTAGYVFSKWVDPDGVEYNSNPVDVIVANDGDVYTAFFVPVGISLGDDAVLYQSNSNISILSSVKNVETTGNLPEGSRVRLEFPLTFDSPINSESIELTVKLYSGDEATEPFVTKTIPTSYILGNTRYYVELIIDPATMDLDMITADVTYTVNSATGNAVKTYEVGTIVESDVNEDFSYLTSPSKTAVDLALDVGAADDLGPDVSGTYAEIDPDGQLGLYFYGPTGVYKLTNGATDITELTGLKYALGYNPGVVALGPDGNGGLIAMVSGVGDVATSGDGAGAEDSSTPNIPIDKVTTPGYDASGWTGDILGSEFLWHWDGTSWSRIADSCFSEYYVTSAGPQFNIPLVSEDTAGLVMAADDIWENNYRWNGEAWSVHSYNFNSFYRVSDELAYAGSSDGIYKYDGSDWTKLGSLTGTANIVSGNTDTLIAESGGTYYKVSTNDGAVSAISTTGLQRINGIGIDYDGTIYAMTSGRTYGGGFEEFGGSYVYKLTDSGWKYQIMTAFDDPNEDDDPSTKIRPCSVSVMSNPIDNITALHSKDGAGAIYWYVGNSTITFDSNGGSAVAPITGKVGSAVTAPESPTYGDNEFAGWYLDNETFEKTFVWKTMPAKDITLYAKWDVDLDPAREAALETLDSEYAKLVKTDYSADNWAKVDAAYQAGKDAIAAAATYDAIQGAVNDAVAAMKAVEADKADVDTVAITMELLTMDKGFIIEPVMLEVPKSQQVSVIITDLLKARFASEAVPVPYRMTGTETNNFYLASVYAGTEKTGTEDGWIGEFDGGTESGWEYCVNGKFPNVGASAWTVQYGDVIRWQYTCVGLGADIGNGFDGATDVVQVADKDALIWRVAEINAMEDKAAYLAENNLTQAYADAMTVLQNIPATQTEVDAALAALGGEAHEEDPVEMVERIIDSIGTPVTLESEKTIKAAREAYDALTEDQKAEVENYNVLVAAEAALAEAKAEAEAKAAAVDALIDAIGSNITLDSEEAITAAREAYDALTDAEKEYVQGLSKLTEAETRLAVLKASPANDIYKDTGDYLKALEEKNGGYGSGSTGGEWAVLGLARSGREVDKDAYYKAAEQFVKNNIDPATGRLDKNKATENARLILALTSIGKDVTNVGGCDLLAGLNDMDYLKRQGINGPIWTLIALDSHDYEPAEGITRDALIEEILAAQMTDGGWNLSSTAKAADPDMTGMAVQALAPYYNSNAAVKAAVDKAIACMSAMQHDDGTFSTVLSNVDTTTSESSAQIIVALSALGIDAATDERFVKNGVSALDALCAFAVDGGGFRHILTGDLDGMATEQGYYALASYYRMLAGQTSLYDMSDVEIDTTQEEETDEEKAADVDEKIEAIGEVTLDSEKAIAAARKAYDALTDEQKALVKNLAALEAAEKKLAELKAAEEAATAEDAKAAAAVDALIDAIGEVTLDSEEAIKAAREAYDALTDDQAMMVNGLETLEEAEAKLAELKAAQGEEPIVEPEQEGPITKAVDKNGKDVEYIYEDVEKKIILTTKKAEEVNDEVDDSKDLTILWQKDIKVAEGTEFPVTLTFEVPKEYQDQTIYVYHFNGTDWEVVGEGTGATVSATFDKLSPVGLVAAKTEAETPETPQTGDSNNIFLWAGIFVTAVASAVYVAGRKRRED